MRPRRLRGEVARQRVHEPGDRVGLGLDRHPDPELARRRRGHGTDHGRGELPRADGGGAHELREAPHRGRRRERDDVDLARDQRGGKRPPVARLPHGLVHGDDVHEGAPRAQATGQRLARRSSLGQEDPLAAQLTPGRERRDHGLSDEALRHERRCDTRPHQGVRCPRPDRRHARAPQIGGRESPLGQCGAHDLHGVAASEDDPVVGEGRAEGRPQRCQVGERHDADRRREHDLGAERRERLRQRGRLVPRPGDDDPSAGQGVGGVGVGARRV